MRAPSVELKVLVARQMRNQPYVSDRALEFLNPFPSRRRQRSPDRQKSYERRHRLAYSGVMPRYLGERFTIGHMAVMRIVADEHRRNGYCDLALDEMAARAGVCRRTARRAINYAATIEGGQLVTIKRRPRPGRKNLTNVVHIVSPEWLSWLKRGSSSERNIGGHLCPPTENRSLKQPKFAQGERPRQGFQGGNEASHGLSRSPPGKRRRRA